MKSHSKVVLTFFIIKSHSKVVFTFFDEWYVIILKCSLTFDALTPLMSTRL